MVFPKISISWKSIIKVFLGAISLTTFLVILVGVYILGVAQGYVLAQKDSEQIASFIERVVLEVTPSPAVLPTKVPSTTTTTQSTTWGGPDLWEAVNKRRTEFGVNALGQRDELCTIASIRLNQLLELGKLDGHEGFSNLEKARPDLAWIFEKYSTVAEFLAQGGQSAQETVSLWENTLGHKKLLTGGEYVWGCIYAQNNFAVAIITF
ncbi:MAG: hypothetical protein ACC618_03675 [Patescibacteria group bacterium]